MQKRMKNQQGQKQNQMQRGKKPFNQQMDRPMMKHFQSQITPELREKLRNMSPEERKAFHRMHIGHVIGVKYGIPSYVAP